MIPPSSLPPPSSPPCATVSWQRPHHATFILPSSSLPPPASPVQLYPLFSLPPLPMCNCGRGLPMPTFILPSSSPLSPCATISSPRPPHAYLHPSFILAPLPCATVSWPRPPNATFILPSSSLISPGQLYHVAGPHGQIHLQNRQRRSHAWRLPGRGLLDTVRTLCLHPVGGACMHTLPRLLRGTAAQRHAGWETHARKACLLARTHIRTQLLPLARAGAVHSV